MFHGIRRKNLDKNGDVGY